MYLRALCVECAACSFSVFLPFVANEVELSLPRYPSQDLLRFATALLERADAIARRLDASSGVDLIGQSEVTNLTCIRLRSAAPAHTQQAFAARIA